jgi:hypothetical protein
MFGGLSSDLLTSLSLPLLVVFPRVLLFTELNTDLREIERLVTVCGALDARVPEFNAVIANP